LQSHKGRIRVESEKGSGAEFVVEIPRSMPTRTQAPRLLVPEAAHSIESLHIAGKA